MRKKRFSKRMIALIYLLVVVEISSLFLMTKSVQSKSTLLDDVNLNVKVKKDAAFAILVQTGNTYENANEFPISGYVFDNNKSGCIDEHGEKVLINGENVLDYDSVNRLAYVSTSNTSYCYLYFNLE